MLEQNTTKSNGRQGLSKKIILKLLRQMQQGMITLHDRDECHKFGDINGDHGEKATIRIINPRAYQQILLQGSVGAGKSYINGDWDTDDLPRLIELFIQNESLFNRIESPAARFFSSMRTLAYQLNLNTVRRSKNNILAHYDLGNDFFQLILDPSMMYSCAVYEPSHVSLEEASQNKIRRICHKLELKSSDHLLEIGTGWGGFAVYAAQAYGCKVTTTTISDKQYAYVKEKIKRLGLENQIELLNVDYRKLSGQFDKVVSIEMIEAVGHQYFDVFFRQCNQLLKPQGLFFLQAIVINDQAYDAAKNEIDFIKTYIFPGGCLPSVFSISKSITSQTRLQLISLEDIGEHYVSTLKDWNHKLLANKETILAQGFSEDFIRMWQFYFSYSAAGFASHYISNIHALWRKRL